VTTATQSAAGDALVVDARRRRIQRWSLAGLVVLLVVACGAALTFGAVGLPVGEVWSTVASHLTGGESPSTTDAIVWEVRAPRVLLALVVGAALALVGVTVQALVRNPLADPYVLGVESGAAAAAVMVTYLGRVAAVSSPFGPTVAAFGGAVLTLVLVFALARSRGRVSPMRLLLVGVALSYAFSGLTSFVLFASPDPGAQSQVLFWILGGLGGATWSQIPWAMGLLLVTYVVVRYHARALNALALGDSTAQAVGLDPDRLRVRLLVVSSLSVAVVVSLAGPIGFVGLVVPHVGRLLFGADHRTLTSASLLIGAIYLVLVDLACRTLFAPSEIPIGVMTAILGTPFFLWLIRHREGMGA
jgi:iron complex transport system permease protein